MIADGVPPGKISTTWVGDTELPVAEVNGIHQPLNRVVEGTVQ
jgi:hypothetical protein